MEYQIWRQLIQILSFRKDLIDTIKPFFWQLNNNNNHEKYNIQEEKHIPFLKLLSKFQLEVLHEYDIINEEIYITIIPKKQSLSTESSNSEDE